MVNILFWTFFQLVIGFKKYSDKLDIRDSEESACQDDGCEFCCLSTFKCGSLEECKARQRPIFMLEILFWTSAAVCTYIIIWMCYMKGKGVNSRNT